MYQQTIIMGNLGRDPDMRFLPNGNPVTFLSVATNRKYTGSDGQVIKETTWFKVSVFGKNAENCAQYLKKGSGVLVEGRLSPDKQTGGPKVFTRPDGSTGATYEVIANTVRFLPGRDDPSAGTPRQSNGESDYAPAGEVSDDEFVP
jgi:single-strand DNA-binding protein